MLGLGINDTNAKVLPVAPDLPLIEGNLLETINGACRVLPFKYHGWTVRWTGWKVSPTNSLWVAQFVAEKPHSCYVHYASYPGRVDTVPRGSEFDISLQYDQVGLTDCNTLMQFMEVRESTRARLLSHLDYLNPRSRDEYQNARA